MKVLFIGKAKSGKTRTIQSLLSTKKSRVYEPTNGVHVYTYNTPSGKELSIWDTAGDDRYIGLGEAYYINADICINFSNSKELNEAVTRITPSAKIFDYKKIKNLREFLNQI